MSAAATALGDPLRGTGGDDLLRPASLLRRVMRRVRSGPAPTPDAAAAFGQGASHPVIGADDLLRELLARLAAMSDGGFDEGNGQLFDAWVLGVTRQWHVLVDLEHDVAERRVRAAAVDAQAEVERRRVRLELAREKLSRVTVALADPDPDHHADTEPVSDRWTPAWRPGAGWRGFADMLRRRGPVADRTRRDPHAPWGWSPPPGQPLRRRRAVPTLPLPTDGQN